MRGISLGRGGCGIGLCIGLFLIWSGFTDNIIKTPMGNELFPRWMYIGGGLILIALDVVGFLLRYNCYHP